MTIIMEEDEIMPICSTCHSLIEFTPYRTVVIEDNYLHSRTLNFHYFFPCWDVDYLLQLYEECKIISAGFSCDPEILKKPLIVRNMEKNSDLWI